MKSYTKWGAGAAFVLLGVGAGLVANASDHADTPELANQLKGADLSDGHIFPSPSNSNNVVLAMSVRPLIAPGDKGTVFFDPNVLYQFKIDNTGDAVEDLVIQVKATGTGANQVISVSGPVKPNQTGTQSTIVTPHAVTGTFGTNFNPTNGMLVYAGYREDPFFFDLERFFQILPDRATPLTGQAVANPNQPQQTSWRPAGQARDFLSTNNLNVLAIVVEIPRSRLTR